MVRVLIWVAVSSAPQAAEDKESLPAQERDLRALAEKNGWIVTDVMVVPGHSRRYIDIHVLAEAAQLEGIDAFHKLLKHFKDRDFDGILVRDADRFARTQSLHAYIVESVIDCGAFIYSLADGRVDSQNFRMFVAMSGYRAAGAVDALMKGYDMAMKARPARGLPAHSRVSWSHKIIRDEMGRALRVELDESKRRIFDDVATLLLEGVSWFNMETEMFQRFGHAAADGFPLAHNFFYKLIYHPQWWGHAARHFRSKGGPNGMRAGLWVFDETYPVPEGVTVYRDVFDPVWTGETARLAKLELTRRKTVIQGRVRPNNIYRFSGLFICGECGYNLKYAHDNRRWYALKCQSRNWSLRLRPRCEQRRSMNETRVQEYIDKLLREAIAAEDVTIFSGHEADETKELDTRIKLLEKEVEELTHQGKRLLNLYMRQPDDSSLAPVYEEQMTSVEEQLKRLTAELERTRVARLSTRERRDQELTLSEIAQGFNHFWHQPPRVINQKLHALMGKRRFVLLDGEVVGTGLAKEQKRPT